jgi:anaerobic magnesium-protoporphyrin IX monomethyl ester cyclase
MVKILFINPFSWSKNEYPPLGMGYLISSVKQAGYADVELLDMGVVGHDLSYAAGFINKYDPDICGISLYSTNVFLAYELISAIKENNSRRITVVGGPHATAMPERTMEECGGIDYLVAGEGEVTIVELLQALFNGGEIGKIRGILYRKYGETIKTPPRPLIQDLDSVQFPDREAFKKYKYAYDPVVKSTPVAPVITGRGCPYDCAFCSSKAVWGRSFRRRSPENLVEELCVLRRRYNVREIDFVDDLFVLNRDWLERFYECLEKEKLDITWRCLARPDKVNESDFRKLRKHGCHMVKFGVESGNDSILRSINKGFTTRDVINANDAAKKAGLNVQNFFIFGHREDNMETARQTLEFAKKLNSDVVSFFVLVPFPGTHNYEFLPENEKYDWKRMGYYHSDSLPFSICALTPGQLLALERSAWREYYGRAGYIFQNVIIKTLKGNSIYLNLGLGTILKYMSNRNNFLYAAFRFVFGRIGSLFFPKTGSNK